MLNAATWLIASSKSPCCSPKKLFDHVNNCATNSMKEAAVKPSHHKTDSLHMGEIQRGRVRFRLPSICRFEIGPFDKQLTRVRMHKIKLPANCTLLASIRSSWQYLVLQRQGVFLAVTVINANAEPFITTQIQVEGPDSPLRGEPSASKRRDVEMTMELCWPNILASQIRLTAAPSYAVVRSGPSAGLPRPGIWFAGQKRLLSGLVLWVRSY